MEYVAPVVLILMVGGYFLVELVLAHRERMARIKKDNNE